MRPLELIRRAWTRFTTSRFARSGGSPSQEGDLASATQRFLESTLRAALHGDYDPPWLTYDTRASYSDGFPYRSFAEYEAMRDQSRWYASNHPFAAAALEVRANYVIGTGHTYRIVPRPDVIVDEAEIARAYDYLLRWMDRDRWAERQWETQYRLDRDGEVFLRFFDAGDTLYIRFVDPELIRPPVSNSAQDAYGIRVSANDSETVEGYWLAPSLESLDRDLIPASEIQHRKCQPDRALPRGIPVLWPCRESLRRVWKIARAQATVAAIQASVAAVISAPAGTPGVQRISLEQQDVIQSQKSYLELKPGAIIALPQGMTWEAPTNRIDVANFTAAIQAELRAIAARLAIPEYMLSGDASNANYSSTLVAEGPAVKAFERLQALTIWYDREIFRRVLRIAERTGKIPRGLTDVIEIEAEAPLVQSRNRLMEAQADQILLSMGVVSRETVAARHGYDWKLEKDRIEAEGGLPAAAAPQPMGGF